MNIKENLKKVQARIAHAADQYHRSPSSIHLLAVSKTKSIEQINEAYNAGQRLFGENYLQEAIPKIHALKNKTDIEFHFIGDIQSNKTKLIAENFSWVHSVDREKIARRLNEQRQEHLKPLNVCIEVNISREESKSGILNFDEVYHLAQFIQNNCPKLHLRGLMTIPLPVSSIKEQRQPYALLKQLFKLINKKGILLDTLSMGMSYDLEAAIAEGTTIVRVGQAIFGQR